MKKILYITMLCLTSIAFSQEETLTTNAVLTFGRYGEDCSGRGACSFTTNLGKAESNATTTYTKDGNLTIFIDRTKISKEEEYKILGKQLESDSKLRTSTFAMEEELKLNSEVKYSLNIPKELSKIAIGNYPIEITETVFIITVNLE